MSYASYDGNTANSSSSKKKAIPFDAPKEGSIDKEVLGYERSTPRRRSSNIPGPYSQLGSNNLNRPKSGLRNGGEVSTTTFYDTPSKSGQQRAPRESPRSLHEGIVQSLVSGVPGGRRLQMHHSPSETIVSQPQFRKANQNETSRGMGKASGVKVKNTSNTEPIEIHSSGDEDDRVETGESRRRSPPKKESLRAANRPQRDNAASSMDFGAARISGPIRRKSDSPQETRESEWGGGQGFVLGDPRDLPPLDAARSLKISNPSAERSSNEMEQSAGSRPRIVDKMKGKDGQISRSHLGQGMESGFAGRGSRTVASTSRTIIETNQDDAKRSNTLRLARVGFCGLAQIQAKSANPSMSWNRETDLQLNWEQGGKTVGLFIQRDDVASFGYIDENTAQSLVVVLKDPLKLLNRLSGKVGHTGGELLLRNGQMPEATVTLLPLTDSRGRAFDESAWRYLLHCIKVETFVTSSKLKSGTFLMLKSTTEDLRDLVSISAATASSSLRTQPRARPSATKPVLEREARITRSASQSVTEDEDKASRASVEAVTKVQAPTEPQKVLLSYPLGSTGAVNVFQSDLDKLDDDEMLNDTIVEFGLKYLLEEIKKRDPQLYDQIYVFSSFFYKRINENKRDRKSAYEFVKKWTRKVDIFKKKYLVVPINEKMHWYLAIITNPFYSIREEEKKRGLYESSGEEEDEEMVDEELDNGGHVDDSKEEAKESAEVASALQSEESKAEQVETMGDTVMEEEKGPKVEVVIPTPSAKAPDEPTKVITSEQMDVDGNDSDDQGRAPFEVKSDADLMHGYEAGRRNLRTTKVIDNRSTPRTSINVSDSDSDDPVLVQSTSARKNKSSQYGRPGLSDGIRNKGNGKSVGGGGGTSFEPGQISDFLKEEEEMAAAKKRKAEEIEEHDVRMGSPLRSRSGTVYNSKTAVQPEKRQEVQERYREWLKKKSVVCVFDSLASTHKAVKTALKEYLCLEYNDKRRDKSMEEIMLDDIELEHIDVASPTQGNFCDCGLYLLHAFERFFSDPKKVMSKLIVFKNRDDPYWQSENAAKKRQWWRSCIKELIEEYQAEQAQIKADKEARLALKSSAAKVESEAKSKTASPSEGSRGTSQTSETTPLEVPSAAESSMEEPKVVRAT